MCLKLRAGVPDEAQQQVELAGIMKVGMRRDLGPWRAGLAAVSFPGVAWRFLVQLRFSTDSSIISPSQHPAVVA